MPKKQSASVPGYEQFLRDVFLNYLTNKTHLDNKINWLAGISGVIMGLALSKVIDAGTGAYRVGIGIIFFSAFITLLICLLIYDVPQYFYKNAHDDHTVMFHRAFYNKTPKQISAMLRSIKSRDDIIDQYGSNMYNLVHRNLLTKNRLFVVARNILFAGLIVGTTLIFIYYI